MKNEEKEFRSQEIESSRLRFDSEGGKGMSKGGNTPVETSIQNTSSKARISRRSFLKGTGACAAGLAAVGFQLPIAIAKEQNVKEEIIMANKADLEKGLELRNKLLGKRASAVTALGELAPNLEEMINEVLFGRVWTRPGLEPKMRSAITIASLMAMQRLPQLKGHIANGLNMGLSKQEIIEILIHIAFYAGVPTAVNAFQLAKEVFKEEGI